LASSDSRANGIAIKYPMAMPSPAPASAVSSFCVGAPTVPDRDDGITGIPDARRNSKVPVGLLGDGSRRSRPVRFAGKSSKRGRFPHPARGLHKGSAMQRRKAAAENSTGKRVDGAIVEAASGGDLERAARLLCHHHAPHLLRFLMATLSGAEAEDVLQETLIAALDALRQGRYTPERPMGRYLRGVARYKALRLRRSFWHVLFHQRSTGPETLDDVRADVDDRQEHPVDLGTLLRPLSERERLVVRLRLARRSYREIALLLGTSEDNAAQLQQRALKRLRRLRVEAAGEPDTQRQPAIVRVA
jgi:RNA polymerase sigma factor (sigma-70 family)